MLSCARLCQCASSKPAANPRSRSVAPNQATFEHCQQPGPDRTNPALLQWPREPPYPSKHRVSRAWAFPPMKSQAPRLFHFPATWWWRWHDDVADMIAGFFYHDHRPYFRSFLIKFPLKPTVRSYAYSRSWSKPLCLAVGQNHFGCFDSRACCSNPIVAGCGHLAD